MSGEVHYRTTSVIAIEPQAGVMLANICLSELDDLLTDRYSTTVFNNEPSMLQYHASWTILCSSFMSTWWQH